MRLSPHGHGDESGGEERAREKMRIHVHGTWYMLHVRVAAEALSVGWRGYFLPSSGTVCVHSCLPVHFPVFAVFQMQSLPVMLHTHMTLRGLSPFVCLGAFVYAHEEISL